MQKIDSGDSSIPCVEDVERPPRLSALRLFDTDNNGTAKKKWINA